MNHLFASFAQPILRPVLLLTLTLWLGLLSPLQADEAGNRGNSAASNVVSHALRHDTSPRLDALVRAAHSLRTETGVDGATAPERRPIGNRTPRGAVSVGQPDPLTHGPGLDGWVPQPMRSFEGIANPNGLLPPDTVGDVGPDHYVQMVNVSMAVWDKAGNLLLSPFNTNLLWQGLGGICESHNDGDPIVLYDQLADRWLVSQFALDNPNFHECIAISQTGDPTGAWHRYDFQMPGSKMNDYPKIGLWPNGYYMAVNQFSGSQLENWAGQGVVVFEREEMLAGEAARMVYRDLFDQDELLGGMLPGDLDGLTLPSPGTPAYFVQLDDDVWSESYPGDQLEVWEFHVDWLAPETATFTGPALLPVAPFDWDLCGGFLCIPQPDTARQLDTVSDRLMHRLQIRQFNGYAAMVVNHTVDVDGQGQAGVRWYELRNPGSGWQLYQQGTYAPDADHRWMASMAMDRVGNIALGYSISSSTRFPSIGYTVREAGDPLGQLRANEVTLVAGGGHQSHSKGRWGDYSMMAVDPVDDCTFWYTQEYYATSSSALWQTRIGAFKIPTCFNGPAGQLTGQIRDTATGSPVVGATIQSGDFVARSQANGDYAFPRLPVGVYTVTVSNFGYERAQVGNLTVQADMTTTQDIALTALPQTQLSGRVLDDSGGGWPLYASVQVAGLDTPIFTDPVSGAYQIQLPLNTPLTLTAQALSPGYVAASRTLTLSGQSQVDLALTVDAERCDAPGYGLQINGLWETFDSPQTPPGWTVTDALGSGSVWRFDDPGARSNLTGGKGGFAIMDSDFDKKGLSQDTALVTPVLDFSDHHQVNLLFDTDLYMASGEVTDVDVSVDGGENWINRWQRAGQSQRGSARQIVDITELAAGQTQVRVRFRYHDATYAWWWQVDNVLVGEGSCLPVARGLLVGHVTDGNTGVSLNQVALTQGTETVYSAATPDDIERDDGFFTLPLIAPTSLVTATLPQYGPSTASVTIANGQVISRILPLEAGWLALQPHQVEISATVGDGSLHQTVQLANRGGRAAFFQITPVDGPPPIYTPALTYHSNKRKFSAKLLDDPTSLGAYTVTPPDAPRLPGGDILSQWPTGLTQPWGIALDKERGDVWLNDGAGRTVQPFTLDGASRTAAPLAAEWMGSFGADMVVDPLSDQLWAVNVGGDGCIHPLSLDSSGWPTTQPICPTLPNSLRGLAYDPISDTFLAGSWLDRILYRLDRRGRVLQGINTDLAIAGLAYNPTTGHLFVSANGDQGYDIYVLDTGAEMALLGGFDISGLAGLAQAGLSIDCAGHLWVVDQVQNRVLQVTSGEGAACVWADGGWLSAQPITGTVSAQEIVTLTLQANLTDLTPGIYTAHLRLEEDTPYDLASLPVTLTLNHRYGVSATPLSSVEKGWPGVQVQHSIRVTNTGSTTDSLSLKLSAGPWAALLPMQVASLPPGEAVDLSILITIAPTAPPGSVVEQSLTISSQTNPSKTISVQLKSVARWPTFLPRIFRE